MSRTLALNEIALVRTATQPTREEELSRMELLDDSQAGTCAFEDFEEQTQGGLYLCIRVEDDMVLRVVYESNRRHLFKLSTASATQDATA